MAHQIRPQSSSDLIGRGSRVVDPSAHPVHLAEPDGIDGSRRLLLLMDPERAEEAGQMAHTSSGLAEPHQQVPIEGKRERLIKSPADLFPDPPSPEEGLLGHEVGPGEHFVVVGRQHPPADLVAERGVRFSGLGHGHYSEARAITDLVPEATLRLTPQQAAVAYPAKWKDLVGL